MMNSENKYKGLTEKELRLLIKYDDNGALDEFIRRCDTGEIKRKSYKNVEELAADWAKRKKAS